MKKLLLLIPFAFFTAFTFAQSGKIDIKGTVIDTAGTPLGFSSVLLLAPADSALVTYALCNDKGEFVFKNVPKTKYLLKATFVSYLPYQEIIDPVGEKTFDTGNISLKPMMQELYEVVVKTARAPISIKGDTVEYDASKFKVPPGSSVEDLLRKLPGVEVLQDGSVQAQGETVQRVTVDGKRFFGGDTKMATKNLGADAIKKVQIFNDKSEQSKLTGVDDGKREKAMNLELKEEAKKGGFGKVTAGVGTDNRAMLSGNYNKFDSKNQLSAIGFGNNLNQTGMSWDDYQDFKGSNSFNWNDDADFGFSGGRSFFRFSSGDDDGESFSIPTGGNGEGFSNNGAAGINYNRNVKKDELSASYFYNQTRLVLDALQNRENFLTNSQSFINLTDSYQRNFSSNHRVTLRGTKEIDSLNTVTFIGNGRLSNSNTDLESLQEFNREGITTNRTTINNNGDRLSYAMATTAIYRHKFKSNKKRSFSASGTYQLNKSDNEAYQNSVNEFLQATDLNEMVKTINQVNATDDKQGLLKSSLLYVEPIGEKFYLESFYNFSLRNDVVDRGVFDKTDVSDVRNSSLSSYYTNTLLYNRIGTGLRYSFKGLNLSFGLAAQQFNLNGQVNDSPLSSQKPTPIDRTFKSVVPNATFSYNLKNNKYVNVDYGVGVQEPQIRDLQPVINNSNPLFITQGNPDLLPQTTHRINGGFHQYNPVNFTNLYIGVNYNYNENQIIYNQTIDPTTLITSTSPENISGGQNLGSYMGFGFPLKKTKATLNINGNFNYGKYLSYINDVQNQTNTNSINAGLRLSLTPIDWFTFYARSNWTVGNTSYSINTNQDQQIVSSNYSGEMNIQMPKSFFITSTFNYRTYVNERFGFDQKQPIWNASVFKQFGEKKRAEVRISAYDILKRNLGISQYASQNFVSTREVQTLSRYFMLSFTYNMRGVASGMKKNRYF
ncbi:Outer membrane receptor proteins, mostly Fe transport [Spirosomataceae bacterium TFI 002]|nr:Outer membrane receptor proteins, mostly Fe transport [Spirosomataceae bacterium TFI 002]